MDMRKSYVFFGCPKILTDDIIANILDSPPTEELFSECDWRDWTSLSYPGMFLR